MGIKERKKRYAGKMRSRILKAAMQLYVKGGYENVTMRRIATKIEYSPGTIYLYFQNKKDIMLQLCYQGFERFLAQQDKLEEIADPLELSLIHISEPTRQESRSRMPSSA